jgi:transcriptional regulator with XRE-family HTH domain
MSGKTTTTSGSSTSMRSAKKRTKKTHATPAKPCASLTAYGQAEVVSSSSSSPLADIYKTEEFRNEWANDVRFHVARNVLYLRRYRRMSQSSVALAMETSQSAIARIESAQENITLDTLQRLTVALNGRFSISIPPQEHSPQPTRPWWELIESANKPWTVVGVVARRNYQTEQVVVGLERRHEEPLISGSLVATPFLPEGKTTTRW